MLTKTRLPSPQRASDRYLEKVANFHTKICVSGEFQWQRKCGRSALEATHLTEVGYSEGIAAYSTIHIEI